MHDAESWDRVFDRVGREGLLLMLGGEVAVAIRDEFPRGSESREECETADLLEALATSEIWSLVYLGAIKRAMGLMFPAPAEDDARHLLAVARTPCDGADDDALAGFVAELEGRRDGPTLALFVAKSGHRDLFEHYARVAPRVVELYLASRHGFDDPTFSA